MAENKDKKHDSDEEFYEGVAEVANFVNLRLHDSIAPGGLNSIVQENSEDDKAKK